jgi:hypothetical protein
MSTHEAWSPLPGSEYKPLAVLLVAVERITRSSLCAFLFDWRRAMKFETFAPIVTVGPPPSSALQWLDQLQDGQQAADALSNLADFYGAVEPWLPWLW